MQDIKKQKAFSFTLKGSLGIMGVVLALSVFGFFSGGKLLCDKGVQSEIGTVKILTATEPQPVSNIPYIGSFVDTVTHFFSPQSTDTTNRVILIKGDNTTVHIVHPKTMNVATLYKQQIIATGQYDSSTSTLTIADENGVELNE